jgi:hypothetical protein
LFKPRRTPGIADVNLARNLLSVDNNGECRVIGVSRVFRSAIAALSNENHALRKESDDLTFSVPGAIVEIKSASA